MSSLAVKSPRHGSELSAQESASTPQDPELMLDDARIEQLFEPLGLRPWFDSDKSSFEPG
jgi:hypothetical protein